MERKWEEYSKKKMLKGMQGALENASLSVNIENLDQIYIRGPNEEDIIFSALEGMLSGGLRRTLAVMEEKGVDLRTAAYINGLNRIYDYFRHNTPVV